MRLPIYAAVRRHGELYKWAPRLLAALQGSTALKDVNSDQQQGGLEADVTIDRANAARLGLSIAAIDNTLYDAFGQRQVSTIYNALNQYHVVMEVAPRYWQDPSTLRNIWVSTSGANPSGVQQTNAGAGLYTASATSAASAASVASDSARNLALKRTCRQRSFERLGRAAVSSAIETMIPLSAVASFSRGQTPLGVNHQGLFAAATISFNLCARPRAERGAEGDRRRNRRHPHAVDRCAASSPAPLRPSSSRKRPSRCCSARPCSPSISSSAFSTRATSIR